MRLIRNSLSGMQLPNVLPESMKQLVAAPPPSMGGNMMSQGMPPLPARPANAYGSLPATPTIGMCGSMNLGYSAPPIVPSSMSSNPSFTMGIKELGDWSIPQQLKLRFSQHFNQLDRNRVGLLTGTQARGVLGESQLPTNLLAQVWTMSDVNKDGCLSIEEFCVAMFLIEMLKAGYALPALLPPELSSFCHRSKTASPLVDPNQPPPQKTQMKTFEDKRRDNLDRGQAELERRRQILREEEDRRRAEIERKEREEAERRERERQELERRRDAEREAERLLEMEREKERAAEEERLKAEREQARKLLEQDRLKELEKIRIRDLENQQQHEVEKTTQIQQRHKTMTFQLQALDEKSQRLNTEITEARDGIIEITGEIEKMRESRDQKLARISDLQTKSQQFAVQCERLSHENLQLQSECQKTFSRTQQIENLKTQIVEKNDLIVSTEQEIQNAKTRLSNQEKLVNEKRPEFESGKEKLQKVVDTYNQLVDKFIPVKQKAEEEKRKKSLAEQKDAAAGMVQRQDSSQLYTLPPDVNSSSNNGFETNFTPDFGAAFGTGQTNNGKQADSTVQPLIEAGKAGSALVKYRALFEFVARSEDELSLQPGDVVLVFEGHASEPGWLAGQIKDKVGWFPASFAEPAVKKPVASAASVTTPTSPSMEPLESIKEDPAEKEFAADFGSAFSSNAAPFAATSHNATTNGTAAVGPSHVSALYDAPPSFDEGLNQTTTEAKAMEITTRASKSESNNSIANANAQKISCVGSALYQWKARNDSELSFNRGDIIEVLEQAEMRWKGRLQKKPELEGWFPKSYIKVTTAETTAVTNSDAAKTKPLVTQKSTEKTVDPSSSNGRGGGDNWYTALYQFDAVEHTDLSLKIGDRIQVLEAKDEWWKGTCNGKTGIFPANYVQKAEAVDLVPAAGESIGRAVAAFEATAANQISLRLGDLVRIHSTSAGGWWEGEVDRDGTKLTGWFPGNYVQVVTGAVGQSNGADSSKPVSLATAVFDYEAQHADELSFKQGDVVEVVDQSDVQWWKGRKPESGGAPLLFPSNFVQLRGAGGGCVLRTSSSAPTSANKLSTNNGTLANGLINDDRLSKQTKELIDTEERFWKEMHMVRAIFQSPLCRVVGDEAVRKIFLNWDQLIQLSRTIHSELQHNPPGEVFCKWIDHLEEFVKFCERQESAVEFLNDQESSNAAFSKTYRACCQHEYAKGVSLSYHLLLPMARITRYPLIFEKMVKYSSPESLQYETLQNAYQLLKALCARVNEALSEMDNKNMLWWSQRSINCSSLRPTLEFTFPTREIGARSFIHAGILYKAKSNKMLVGLLYSDFLLLATPNEQIHEPDFAKITKNSEITLTLYKTPLMVKNMVLGSIEDNNFLQLKTEDFVISLKTPSPNARILWVNKLQKTIDQYNIILQTVKAQETLLNSRASDSQLKNPKSGLKIGRLVLEVVSIEGFDSVSAQEGRWLTCQVGFTTSSTENTQQKAVWMSQKHKVDLTKTTNYISTQLQIEEEYSSKEFYLAMLIPMKYRPDLKIGECSASMKNLVIMSSSHPGLIHQTMKLQNGEIGASNCSVNFKFFIQMFD